VMRTDMDSEARKKWALRTVLAINKAFPQVKYKNWQWCEKVLPHAQLAYHLINEFNIEIDEAERLLNQTATYLIEQAAYTKIEPMLLRALEISEKALGKTSKIATHLNNLAELYRIQGEYAKAETLYKKSLKIRKSLLVQDHPDIALTLHNLAALYYLQGKNTDAEPLFHESLKMWRTTLKPDHPLIARCLNNLALLYQSIGQYSDAEPLYISAIEICEKNPAENIENVAGYYSNLGGLYHQLEKYNEAQPLIFLALQIMEKVLYDSHPNLATIYYYSDTSNSHNRALLICFFLCDL